jgi:hypothetical protein
MADQLEACGGSFTAAHSATSVRADHSTGHRRPAPERNWPSTTLAPPRCRPVNSAIGYAAGTKRNEPAREIARTEAHPTAPGRRGGAEGGSAPPSDLSSCRRLVSDTQALCQGDVEIARTHTVYHLSKFMTWRSSVGTTPSGVRWRCRRAVESRAVCARVNADAVIVPS